jgi:cholesterol oxidase
MRRQGQEAFAEYQWSHSPRTPSGKPRELPAPDGHQVFDYKFRLRGFPFFVCDTRSGRSEKGILDEGQFQDLLDWLPKQPPGRPKFVVSPSVVMPFLRATGPTGHRTRSDAWDGYPDQVERLFRCIYENQIDDVVFLCGDAHLSMESSILFFDRSARKQPFKAHCIVASPMYAPYPFANSRPEEYLEKNGRPRTLKLDGLGEVRCTIRHHADWNSIGLVTVSQPTPGTWEVRAEFLPAPLKPKQPTTVEVPAGPGIPATVAVVREEHTRRTGQPPR